MEYRDHNGAILHLNDHVDRFGGEYYFPGKIIALYEGIKGGTYAVVEMDTYRLQHIFRTDMLVKRDKNDR
jgi:hypothetical protein